jgi:PAS domain S-box-containing protein
METERMVMTNFQIPKPFYETMFENLPDGLAYCEMIFDGKGRPVDFVYIRINKNFERVTGFKRAEGRKVTELMPGIRTSNPEMLEACGRVSLTGKAERFETRIEPRALWLLVSVYSPREKFFVAMFQNITDRKQIENDLENAKIAARNVSEDLQAEKERIAQTNAKDEAILASIADGCIAVNENGEIIVVNQMAQKMLGYTGKESIGKHWYEILHREDEAGNRLSPEQGAIRAALSTTASAVAPPFSYVRKDGTKFPVSRTVAPITLQGKIIGAVNIFRDITREKEIDRAKSEFISIASHQLRTPLTGIQWVIERFTKKEKLTAKGKEYLDDIHTSAKRLTELVDLMLNLSRIEAGKIDVTPELIEVVGLVADYLKETTGLREKKGLRVIFDDHPVKCMAVTDKNALRNIVQSIISNAIEYTPDKGKIEIGIQKKGVAFVMWVKDTGIGIPKAEQHQVFEKFMRATNAKLYKTNGTGIGLYIAQWATTLLGGKIWFESKESKGSTFYVELPLKVKQK